MCCGEFVAKYVLFFFNLACTLVGLAFIVLGIVVITNITDLVALVPDNLNLIPIALIVFGCVVFFIAFLGCWGAVREKGCMLVMYAVIMLILAALKIWLAVVLYRNLGGLQSKVTTWLEDAFNNPNLQTPFHVMESSFKCCGTTGPNSYLNASLPGSCCGLGVMESCSTANAFGGCTTTITDYLQSYGDLIGGVLITIIVAEIIAMFLGLFLNHTISQKQRY